MRDFIYIKDTIKMTLHFFTNSVKSGIYNIGTGQAEPFNKLGSILIEKFPDCEIEYIKFPTELKKTYQAYTCANIGKLRSSGYNESVLSLKDAINDYLENEKVK